MAYKTGYVNQRDNALYQFKGYDKVLFFCTFCLVGLGILMVTSSSIGIAHRNYDHAFFYLLRQLTSLGIGLLCTLIILRIDIALWERFSGFLLVLSIVLLLLVLIPGLGISVNGARRWLGVGPIRVQVSEIVKLFAIVYVAGYMVRHKDVLQHFGHFLKPLGVIGVLSLLLLKQPDFGAAAVITSVVLGMLFLAGVRLWQFIAILGVAGSGFVLLAITSPYRLARLTTFLNPWETPFDGGYQLTQSLIAFGRGGWFGVGLGESVQKMFYLPEAHTDFVFAVIVEELGLLGGLIVMGLFCALVIRAFQIGRAALNDNNGFSGYLAYGLSLWLGMQALINMGVSTGLLPTKGLTLPLLSYGRSSMIISCCVIGLLLRIDYETRRRPTLKLS